MSGEEEGGEAEVLARRATNEGRGDRCTTALSGGGEARGAMTEAAGASDQRGVAMVDQGARQTRCCVGGAWLWLTCNLDLLDGGGPWWGDGRAGTRGGGAGCREPLRRIDREVRRTRRAQTSVRANGTERRFVLSCIRPCASLSVRHTPLMNSLQVEVTVFTTQQWRQRTPNTWATCATHHAVKSCRKGLCRRALT